MTHRYPETWGLRDTMRAAIGALRRGRVSDCYPQTAAEIFEALESDWGRVGHRRLWRTLWWLLARGYVIRLGTPRLDAVYVLGYAPMRYDEHDQRMAVEFVTNGLCWNCGLTLRLNRSERSKFQCSACDRNRNIRGGRELYRALADAGICVACHGEYAAPG